MSIVAWFFLGPLYLITLCIYVSLLVAVGCALARFARPARLRVTLRLRGRVREDGDPLTADEMYLLAGIERGLKPRAPEPQYQDEGEW